ncbi:hypothetical protein [Oceanobacillus kimchii]|uniref:hypothetical protein n=1 Tax=Oceanobacillus kimchii TaxID=746691 RepID=UPI003C737AD5
MLADAFAKKFALKKSHFYSSGFLSFTLTYVSIKLNTIIDTPVIIKAVNSVFLLFRLFFITNDNINRKYKIRKYTINIYIINLNCSVNSNNGPKKNKPINKIKETTPVITRYTGALTQSLCSNNWGFFFNWKRNIKNIQPVINNKNMLSNTFTLNIPS